MAFLLGKYISAKGFKGLEEYKYHGLDRSLLANYVFQPFWNRVVQLLPLWMAPNLVTLIGFFFIVLSYVLVYLYIPNIGGSAPSWVYYACAINLFLYQTFDAIDGKQARRTNSSSPLGELFDHGCDAVTTVLQGLIITSTIQLGPGFFLHVFLLSCMTTFFAKQWEEYHTSVFELGAFNVTEAQIIAITVYTLTGYLGPDFWLTEATIAGHTLRYGQLAATICFLGGIPTTLNSVWETFRFYTTKHNNYRMSNGTEALLQPIPVIIVIVFSTLWFNNSPSLLHDHPHAASLAVGFVFCNIIGRIVLARVCKQNLNLLQPLVLPFIVGFLLSTQDVSLKTQALFLQASALAAVLAYLHFALSVIDAICKHIKIRCLSIPYPGKKV